MRVSERSSKTGERREGRGCQKEEEKKEMGEINSEGQISERRREG